MKELINHYHKTQVHIKTIQTIFIAIHQTGFKYIELYVMQVDLEVDLFE